MIDIQEVIKHNYVIDIALTGLNLDKFINLLKKIKDITYMNHKKIGNYQTFAIKTTTFSKEFDIKIKEIHTKCLK